MPNTLHHDSGRVRLLELGIKQTLQRPLHWSANSAVCFCIMSPLTGITGLYLTGLLYGVYSVLTDLAFAAALHGTYASFTGGAAVLIWGWILTSLMTVAIGLAMSELSSAFPVSGGLYFWSFMLARQHGPVASWVVGWLNLLGQAGCCSLLEQWHTTLKAECIWILTDCVLQPHR